MRKYIQISFEWLVQALHKERKDFSYMVIDDDSSTADFSVKKVGELDLSDINFQGINFNNHILSFKGQHFQNCNFDYAVIPTTVFKNCTFDDKCTFNRATMFGCILDNAVFAKGVYFADTDLRLVSFKGTTMTGVNMPSACLTRAFFNKDSNFSDALLRDASLNDLHRANLACWENADMTGALVNSRKAASRFKGAVLENIRSFKHNRTLSEAVKRIYFTLIGLVFKSSDGKVLAERAKAEIKIRHYALMALGKLGIPYECAEKNQGKKKLLCITLAPDDKAQKTACELGDYLKSLKK